ncbi:polysaccharide pyruvyl transferase family protein [Anatilimnocola sp. NA78]|uniref:polysaccharide pyruvyl transferase family protein n=1 Tax=Anatilimnocola sp. NA78 TaxID=3415683 RepID=UPI003CE449F0
MQRRDFLATSFGSVLAATIASSLPAQEKRQPRVVLRSGWQTVNIGDIGHTPGVLTILEKHLPGLDVRLWPSSVGDGVEALLLKRFPNLKIVKTKAEIDQTFAECDFLLHGSGSGFVAVKDVGRWHREAKKPFGIFGISHAAEISDNSKELLSASKFNYFRDSHSLAAMKKAGVTCPVMEFGPDGAFAVDLRNDAAADQYLKENDLQPGKFMCCIPRLRYTPYWLIKKGRAFEEAKHARNEEMKDHDHAPLREAIVALVRETDLKVLVCPEDMSHMAVGKEQIIDKLPADVKKRVVWRENYWLTDEALSTYVRSAGLFGNEMHSPIMCIGNGVPAIVCRFSEQTTKGWMWDDIGLKEWLFDHDLDEAHKGLTAAVLAIAKDPAAAKAKVAKAHAFVQERQRAMCETLKKSLA